jgi:hypothetical protein
MQLFTHKAHTLFRENPGLTFQYCVCPSKSGFVTSLHFPFQGRSVSVRETLMLREQRSSLERLGVPECMLQSVLQLQ